MTLSEDDIEKIVIDLIASKVGKNPGDIDTNTGFIEIGLESLAMIELIEALEEKFGELPPTLLFDYPNIQAVVEWLSKNKPQ